MTAIALHGAPDCRRIWALFDVAAIRSGVRLVCPDRPGFGLSTSAPDRRVTDSAADVTALADHLGLDRFPLLTISAGAIHGCTTASLASERVSGLGMLAPLGPLDVPRATDGMNRQIRLNYWLSAHAPWLLRPIVVALCRSATRNPDRAMKRVLSTRPDEDRAVVARPEVLEILAANLPEQFRDPDSILREFRAAVAPWPVDLASLRVPTRIWHGLRDDVHTPSMARHLERSISGAERVEEAGFATFNFVDTAEPIFAHVRSWGSTGTDRGR